MDTHVKCSIWCTSYNEERRPSKTWRHSLLQNILWFHGTHTNIIPYMPVIYTYEKRLGFPVQFFTQLVKSQQHCVLHLLYRNSLEPDNKLCCFSQNSQSLITFFWTFYLLNFIPHMGKISFMPSSKYCFHCTNFHETHNCSMALTFMGPCIVRIF
jgi:hypothetical protein